MENYNFELFTGIKGKFTPTISISKPGILSFSSGAQHRFKLSEFKAAQLLFDKEKKTIAVRLFEQEGEGRFNLRARPDNKGSFIACKSFISAYEIDPFYGKRFTPIELEHPDLGHLLLLDLSKPN